MTKIKKQENNHSPGKIPCPTPQIGSFTLELIENRKMLLSGCTGIASFSPDCIRLRSKKITVVTEGEGLSLCWAGDGKIMLEGEIHSVGFDKGRL